MNITKHVFAIVLLSIVACGGGGDSTDRQSEEITSQAHLVSGNVILAQSEDEIFKSKQSEIKGFMYSSSNSGELSIYDLSCYSSVIEDRESIVKDIEINNDSIPDINISHNSGGKEVVFKNLSLDTVGITDIVDIPDITQLTADKFLYDLWIELEPNIDINADGVPDLNITASENIIFSNIDINGDEIPDLNVKTEPSITQHIETIHYLNRDIDFDGTADINLDSDYDGIAETDLDENNDCLADYSIIDTNGSALAGATVELIEPGSRAILSSTNADEGGNFQFSDIKTGRYYLKIEAQRDEKIVWSLANIYISTSGDLGTFRASSGPKIVGVDLPNGVSHLPYSEDSYPSHKFSKTIDMSLDLGHRIDFSVYIIDPNDLPVFIPLIGRDENYVWQILYRILFTEDLQTKTKRIDLSFVVEEDGCLWEQTGGYRKTLDPYMNSNIDRWCRELLTKDINNIESLRFSFDFNNDDEKFSADGHRDIYFNLFVNNSNFLVANDDIPSVILRSITLNGDVYENTSEDPRDGINIRHEPDSQGLELRVLLDADLDDPDQYLWIESYGRYSSFGTDWKELGEEVVLDFSQYKPMYTYRFDNIVCATPDETESCFNVGVPYFHSTIRFTPNRNEKPPIIEGLIINDMPYSDLLLQSGERVTFKVLASDPNGLENLEVSFSLNGRSSEWLSIDQGYNIDLLESDAVSESKVWVRLRNNDGIASIWDGIDQNEEFDVKRSFFLNISE